VNNNSWGVGGGGRCAVCCVPLVAVPALPWWGVVSVVSLIRGKAHNISHIIIVVVWRRYVCTVLLLFGVCACALCMCSGAWRA